MELKTNHGVFPDYLRCSYGREAFPEPEISSLLLDLGFSASQDFPESFVPPDGHGLVRYLKKARFTVLSLSGGALSSILRQGEVGSLLQVLTLEHHKVTRLDLAQDISFNRASQVAARLDHLFRRGYTGWVRLGKKAVSPIDVKRFQASRRDGVITGTVYFGSRKNRYAAKVYDKRAEMAANRDIDICVELLRVEVTAARGTATLRDLLEPDPLFFYLASPELVSRPPDVSTWRYTEMDPLMLPPLAQLTDHERMIRLIENSPDLELLRVLIDAKPTELPLVLSKLEAKLRSTSGNIRAA